MYFKVIHGIITNRQNRGQQISITQITLLSLTLYAQSYFPQHLKKWGKNLENLKGGQTSKKYQVDATPSTLSPKLIGCRSITSIVPT